MNEKIKEYMAKQKSPQKEILARCGYRCDLCLAYKDNIKRKDEREFLSDTWYKIYGFRIPAKDIYCEGCISLGKPKLIDTKCPVRPCVIKKGLKNCSECNEYPCDKFNQRKVVREDLLKSKKIRISKKEYSKCIKPYENKLRLDKLKEMKDKKVDEYINKQKSPQKEICQKLRRLIFDVFPKIEEEMKWGVPAYGGGKYYIVALKDHVNLGFSLKGLTKADYDLFDSGGKTMKHIEIASLKDINKKRIIRLLEL